MLQSAYLLAKIGADTVENEQHFAKNLPKTGNYPTGPCGASPRRTRRPRLRRSTTSSRRPLALPERWKHVDPNSWHKVKISSEDEVTNNPPKKNTSIKRVRFILNFVHDLFLSKVYVWMLTCFHLVSLSSFNHSGIALSWTHSWLKVVQRRTSLRSA